MDRTRLNLKKNVERSSELLNFFLDFRHAALFLNAGESNGTGVENGGQILDSHPSVKLGKR